MHVETAAMLLYRGPAKPQERQMTAVQPNAVVKVGSVEIGNARKLSIIAGPCALESRAHALEMALALKEMAAKAGVGLVYNCLLYTSPSPRDS